ncbi:MULTISPECIES: class I SAM-dependent methyltransferase [unclassified Mycobacterium]|uniref:class I SAM-dependent methyltransferase n=1 Tax=unclassified Mycobacterium TaxID=2642494 RepID=UPI0029C98D6D|nr:MULTISPECIES: class I SAM-dependent methyltransferase [unclassified Mycobacterium]
MTRSADDSWDIVTGVGSTAVIVAAFRAEEAKSAAPLARDEFAELLISTPQLSELRESISSGWASSPEQREDYLRLVSYHAVRTHFFDRFCSESSAAGIEQVVILAAGLDSRAYRLGWTPRTSVYEIDMPEVLDYKTDTLALHRVAPKVKRCAIGVDLRTDWPSALRGQGFDAARPSAWLMEGLLPFLDPQAQHSLFGQLDALSAQGSRVGAEDYSGVGLKQAIAKQRDAGTPTADSGFALDDVWSEDAETDCAAWFGAHGWHSEVLDSRRESERLGRPVRSLLRGDDPVFANFITATKA